MDVDLKARIDKAKSTAMAGWLEQLDDAIFQYEESIISIEEVLEEIEKINAPKIKSHFDICKSCARIYKND